MGALSEARKKMSDHRIEFQARAEAQYQLESAELRAAVDREVWKLADQGYSKASIMKEYGTKDFRTVDNILKKRIAKPTGPILASVQGTTYDVRAFDEHVIFDLEDDVAMFHTWEDDYLQNGRLASEIRNNPPFLAKIKEAANG